MEKNVCYFKNDLNLLGGHLNSSFATFYLRLTRIFDHIASNYQTATRWDFPPLRISIWLFINYWMLILIFLDEVTLDLRSYYCNLPRRGSGFELVSTIAIVLQTNQLTKCTNLLYYNRLDSKGLEHLFVRFGISWINFKLLCLI